MKTYCYDVCFAPSGDLTCIRKLEVEKLVVPNSFNRYLATEKIDEDSFYIVTQAEYPFEEDKKYGCYVGREMYFTNLEAAKKYAEGVLTRKIQDLLERAEELKQNLASYKVCE